MKINVTVPRPYALQAEIIEHPTKRKVVVAGRRAGKTVLTAILGVQAFLSGKRVLLTSTTQDQADVFWRYVTDWLATLHTTDLAYKNETRRILKFNNGFLRVKTGSDADVLRGDDADLIVFDECAMLDPDAWFAVGAPMLADRDGDAVFVSTPRRRNWFFNLYQHAKQDTSGRWAAWHFTTLANPHLSDVAVNELAQDMTEDMYRQEILAEFLEGQGQVFRRIREAVNAQPERRDNATYVIGVDWAQVQDYTVFTVLDATNRQVVEIDRFNGIDWALQRGRLATLYEKYKPVDIRAETNSIGGPNIEALQRQGMPVSGFTTTASSKPPLIESLVLAFERGEIGIIDHAALISELEAYERTVSSTGRSRYNAPSGLHDDCVISLALAWQAALETQTSRTNITFW